MTFNASTDFQDDIKSTLLYEAMATRIPIGIPAVALKIKLAISSAT
jgi:hypothetical protein